MSGLRGKQEYTGLYHGTRAAFRGAGGLVIPGDEVEPPVDNHGMRRSHVVYITTDLDEAKEWARTAKGRGKPRVLEVTPWSEPLRDHSTVAMGEEHSGFTCTMATVLRVVWQGE